MKSKTAAELLLIPVDKLRPSRRKNVRRTGGTSIASLAESIARVGLLQNLIVVAAENGWYDVVAGKRRLAAIKLLVKNKRLRKTHEVACLLVPDDSARTISLTENTQREAMHPADEFEAFRALVDDGRSVEDVAADFGVTPLVVQRRLRLANVSPRLIESYRAGEATLDQLMALSITDDHAAQEAAFYEAPEWQREPGNLRGRLTQDEVDAAKDLLARFLGVDAYEAAGGVVRRDLFADEGRGVYLCDVALLERLAQDKLKATAEAAGTEGWSWVEVAPRATPSDLYDFQRVQPESRQPTAKEAKRIARLEAQLGKLEQALESEDEPVDQDEANALYERGEKVAEELNAARQALAQFSEDARGVAGAVVTLGPSGEIVVHRGLVKPEDERRAKALPGAEGKVRKAKGPANASVSEALARRLSAHRTVALQAELSRQPDVALVAVVHALAVRVLYRQRFHGSPLRVDCTLRERLEDFASEIPESPAMKVLSEAREGWVGRLPADASELFGVLQGMEPADLLSLLALCAALCLDAVSPREAATEANELSAAVKLDMAQWWTPTAAGYFGLIPKARILEAVKTFAPKDTHQLDVMKKGELAETAERLAAGKGWLPAMLRQAA
ncbi:MAG: ParB/RepB/Spo0J family partition protein [Nevskia sp.]|nr:ParB/RepB/Spo0J family partition protein [Nevskia sp.]